MLIQAPHRTAQRDIDLFFAEKQPWLRKHITRQQEQQAEKRQKAFQSGESFLFLGEHFPLHVEDRPQRPEALTFTGREFVLSRDALPGARVLFLLWYQRKAQDYLAVRVAHFSPVLGLSPQSVAISRARCRWGSCSADDRLIFSWRIIMAPPAVIDFVVIHEMGHMKIRNHSRDYWLFIESVLPDYKKRKDWLRNNGHLLML